MAKIENLTDQNVEELQKVFREMKQTNIDLNWQFYNQGETSESGSPDLHSRITTIEDKIDTLARKIDLIFGKAVLINGNFVNAG